MKRFRRVAVSLVIAVALLAGFALPVAAANPTVSITVTAQVVSITNSKASWAIGTVDISDIVYFSVDGDQDDDYSLITNTGSVAVDIEIQGTDIDGGSYNWTLASAAGSEQYALYANSSNGSSTYDIEVKSSSYNDLYQDLAADKTYQWSMNFTAPTAFNANDDGNEKSATVTLVASKH